MALTARTNAARRSSAVADHTTCHPDTFVGIKGGRSPPSICMHLDLPSRPGLAPPITLTTTTIHPHPPHSCAPTTASVSITSASSYAISGSAAAPPLPFHHETDTLSASSRPSTSQPSLTVVPSSRRRAMKTPACVEEVGAGLRAAAVTPIPKKRVTRRTSRQSTTAAADTAADTAAEVIPVRVAASTGVSDEVITAPSSSKKLLRRSVTADCADIDTGDTISQEPRAVRRNNGYQRFLQDNWWRVQQQLPGAAPSEVMTLLGRSWSGLGDRAKQHYNQLGHIAAVTPPPRRKGAANPFFLYVKQQLPRLQLLHPRSRIADLLKILGQDWRQLTNGQKQQYKDMSLKLRLESAALAAEDQSV